MWKQYVLDHYWIFLLAFYVETNPVKTFCNTIIASDLAGLGLVFEAGSLGHTLETCPAQALSRYPNVKLLSYLPSNLMKVIICKKLSSLGQNFCSRIINFTRRGDSKQCIISAILFPPIEDTILHNCCRAENEAPNVF